MREKEKETTKIKNKRGNQSEASKKRHNQSEASFDSRPNFAQRCSTKSDLRELCL